MEEMSSLMLVRLLEEKIKRSTQKEVAQELNISRSYLNDIIHEKRSISNNLANKLGYEKVTTFVRMA